MTASTQEGTDHPIRGRSSDSPLFPTLSTFSSNYRTMAYEASERRNTQLQSDIQRPDRPGFKPEFPVHPITPTRTRSPQTARHSITRRSCVNSNSSQKPIHVLLVGLDAGLAVGIEAQQSTFDHGREHEHLKILPQRSLVGSWQIQVGRGAFVIA